MNWKIIEINNGIKIKLYLKNLFVILENKEIITIPINDIDVIIINNYMLNLSLQVLNALSEQNVMVILCNNKGVPQSQILPFMGHYNTLKIFENQLQWNLKYKGNTWKSIIIQKIKNQRDLLKFFELNYDRDFFANNIKETKIFDATNCEGHVARYYWNVLFGDSFKRHADDYKNQLLNYGYAILRSYFARTIVKKGLDPRISFFHKSFHNHFALASDLMEPFRILIDQKVYQLTKNLKTENWVIHKQILINHFNCRLKIENNFFYLNKVIDVFIDAIVNQIELPKIDYINVLEYECE